MNIDGLRLFCDLVETRNFRKAGQKRGVSQSAVSQLIQSMERQLKVPLVVRKRRMLNGFEITPEGKLFLVFAQQTLRNLDEASQRIGEWQTRLALSIRVASDVNVGLYELPDPLRRLEAEYPGIKLHAEYCTAEQVYKNVLNGTDLGLVEFPRRGIPVKVVRLRNEPLVLACQPPHRLAKLNVITSRALQGERVLTFEPDAPVPGISDRLLKHAELSLQTVTRFDNIEALKRAAETGLGVAILPEGTIRGEVAAGTLKAVPLEPPFSRPLAVVYFMGKRLTPAMDRLIELLKEPDGTQ